ncbi:ERF family protein [Micromonospora sp. NPDC005113]
MAANISEVLLDLQADPPVLVKDKKGQVGNQKTKYADLVQVNEQVLSRLNKLGVIYTCTPTLDDDGKFVLAYELEHVESKTAKTGRYPLKQADNPMQMGSAITYARRYVLLAITGIAAEDEDDDGHAASGQRTAQRAAQPRQQAEAPAARTAQRAPRPAAAPPLPGETAGGIKEAQRGKLHASLRDAGFDRAGGLARVSKAIGRDITSTSELTVTEASTAIDALATQEQPA